MCNVNFSDITDFQELDSAFRYEITWLEQVFNSLQNYSTNDETTCNGWAAHHASKKQGSKYPPGINTRQGCNIEYKESLQARKYQMY